MQFKRENNNSTFFISEKNIRIMQFIQKQKKLIFTFILFYLSVKWLVLSIADTLRGLFLELLSKIMNFFLNAD